MKKLFFTVLFIMAFWAFSTTSSFAQISTAKNAVSYKLTATDYKTILLNNFFESDNYDLGAEISYSRHLNKYLNLYVPMRISRIDYPTSDVTFDENRFSAGGDLDLVFKFNNGKILKETARVSPYLYAGIGANYNGALEDNIDVQIPLGGGINWKLTDVVSLQTQAEYRLSVLEDYNNIVIAAGVNFLLERPAEPEPIIEKPADADGDGVADVADDCPNTPGVAALNGCPDKDEDGIADKDDRCPDEAGKADFDGCPDTDNDGLADLDDDCPNEAGPLSNKGCPEADADGDGVIDANDECPNTVGLAVFNGCPDTDGDNIKDADDDCPEEAGLPALNGCPDKDGDTVADKDDRCPDEAGPATNKGCPEIKEEEKEKLEFAKRAVQFETASSTIKAKSYFNLDQVAQILRDYPAYSLSIEGHTDSIGDEGNNQKLSERRAKSCFDYLVGKGISPSRMSYVGYGEAVPVADNKTKAGRAQNRRVEFNIFLK